MLIRKAWRLLAVWYSLQGATMKTCPTRLYYTQTPHISHYMRMTVQLIRQAQMHCILYRTIKYTIMATNMLQEYAVRDQRGTCVTLLTCEQGRNCRGDDSTCR
ncbi:hypothetical protein C2E23DRAFT_617531 [Lenzites betulinus]|nr:hypothetical protein C2E23DRAFT_617531 [Lenzites betulinus]